MSNKHKATIEKLKSASLSLDDASFSSYKDEIVAGQVKVASGPADLEIAAKRFSSVVGVSTATLFSDMKSKFKVFKKAQKAASRLIENRYVVEDGCMAIATPDGLKKIADCSAQIVAKLINEDGIQLYRIKVVIDNEQSFSFSISAEDFSEQRVLKAMFESAMGHNKAVSANMSAHLGPAIKALSDAEIETRLIFNKTGWKTVDGERRFLIPGVGIEGVDIELPGKKLGYELSKQADLNKALEALDHLLRAHPPEVTTIALAFIMQPPLAELAQWHEERYALFIQGLTGSLKTAFVQVLMCIWGKDFNKDGALLKWGEGATNNAIMKIATHACDMPFLIDNYKPNTGGGARAIINLTHNILEGGEKERLHKNSELRNAGSISAWPQFTGEDFPYGEASTVARQIIVYIPKRDGFNEELKVAQDLSEHLNAIGALWLQVLETWMKDKEAAESMRKLSVDLIRKWSEKLHDEYPRMVNKMRIATNLATNEFTWHLLCGIPQLQPILSKYSNAHAKGLEEIAKNLAESTCGSTEAEQFLEALREALQTGKLNINKERGLKGSHEGVTTNYHGWWENGNLYISADTVTFYLEKKLGLKSNNVSKQTLHRQLDVLGAIAEKGKDTHTKVIDVNGESCRVLVLIGSAVRHQNPDADSGNPIF